MPITKVEQARQIEEFRGQLCPKGSPRNKSRGDRAAKTADRARKS